MKLNDQQINKLSDLFMDIARGLFLAAFATPILTNVDFLLLSKLLISGILYVYFSLKLLKQSRRY